MKTIKIPLKVKYSKDKKTGSWVIYSKKFEVSSYGKTKKKAKEMFVHTIEEILLITKPKKK